MDARVAIVRDLSVQESVEIFIAFEKGETFREY